MCITNADWTLVTNFKKLFTLAIWIRFVIGCNSLSYKKLIDIVRFLLSHFEFIYSNTRFGEV